MITSYERHANADPVAVIFASGATLPLKRKFVEFYYGYGRPLADYSCRHETVGTLVGANGHAARYEAYVLI
jgi:hypothetical protein